MCPFLLPGRLVDGYALFHQVIPARIIFLLRILAVFRIAGPLV